ncbi:MAG: proline dehydrogenase family protein [Ignavibacteria bacterium]|nr:proline dehydrogenase family protein [Ignavibacteria bacterium]MBT8381006.1 proline dehydrogenase family protein [Ignavibacteria bacterium]MBT8391504.1 proline dehydrogenase family protein [Ignavibacteria bacterium]NNJ51654.1 proline dehydrogenase [Ignavibacteriaceae bacterium]NNL22390.1 proline dehydrogenase [Ignavibacteriaceae bacterium]
MSVFQKILVKTVSTMPKKVVWLFSKKYIAGTNLQSALDVVNNLNSKGIYATLDVLGEAVTNKEEALIAKNNAMLALNSIVRENLMANLSVKPTQMGLSIDKDFACEQILELVKRANELNNFVRIDMEDSPYTSSTIEIYKQIYEQYPNLGIVLQAYLKRTYDDAVILNKIGTNYRLCKGIYIEPPTIAYKDKKVIRDNFMNVLELILKNGNYVGIATHDKYLIEKSYKLIKDLNIPKDKFEFQMLLGVREDLRDKINSDGYKIRIYVPFGKDWYAYSMRRLQENPQLAGHIFKEFFAFR